MSITQTLTYLYDLLASVAQKRCKQRESQSDMSKKKAKKIKKQKLDTSDHHKDDQKAKYDIQETVTDLATDTQEMDIPKEMNQEPEIDLKEDVKEVEDDSNEYDKEPVIDPDETNQEQEVSNEKDSPKDNLLKGSSSDLINEDTDKEFHLNLDAFTTFKKDENFGSYHDFFAFSDDLNKIAACDGVSNSFLPAIWSSSIAKKFAETGISPFKQNLPDAQDTTVSPSTLWLEDLRANWFKQAEELGLNSSKFYIRNSFKLKKSAAATMVGLELKDREWEAIAIGDSFLFQYDRDWTLKTLHTTQTPVDTFSNYPDYWDSMSGRGKGEIKRAEGEFEIGDFFLLVTDAMAEWIFERKDKPEQLKSLLEFENNEAFSEFVIKARQRDGMDDDDTTLVIVKIQKDEGENLSNAPDLDDLIAQAKKEVTESKRSEISIDEGSKKTEEVMVADSDLNKAESEHQVNLKEKLKTAIEELSEKAIKENSDLKQQIENLLNTIESVNRIKIIK